MKPLQECKDEVAIGYKLDSWEEAVGINPSFAVTQMDTVARLYAQYACQSQREICAKTYHRTSKMDGNYKAATSHAILNASEPEIK